MKFNSEICRMLAVVRSEASNAYCRAVRFEIASTMSTSMSFDSAVRSCTFSSCNGFDHRQILQPCADLRAGEINTGKVGIQPLQRPADFLFVVVQQRGAKSHQAY